MRIYYYAIFYYLLLSSYGIMDGNDACNNNLINHPGKWLVKKKTKTKTETEDKDTDIITQTSPWDENIYTWQWSTKTMVNTNCTPPRHFDRATASQCLNSTKILFSGCSTTRELFMQLAEKMNQSISVHPCNLSLGQGCYDCHRGCKNDVRVHPFWADMTVNNITGIEFTWKPAIFSLDDLKKFNALRYRPDALILHKGVHDASDFIDYYEKMGLPVSIFLDEITERASSLINTIGVVFPKAKIFWRTPYYNWKDTKKEHIQSLINQRILKIISASTAPIYVLPGYEISKSGIPSFDGIHQQTSVKEVVLDIILNIVCKQLAPTLSAKTI